MGRKRVRFDLPQKEPRSSGKEYVVESFVDMGQHVKGRRIYRVRWLDYNPEEDTWEPAENLPQHFIRRFDQAATRQRRGYILVADLRYLGLGPLF
jgi:Chromo (CHRromatin Organisation MOdifier) domain